MNTFELILSQRTLIVYASAPYLFPGPVMSGHPDVVQNSLIVPYTKFTCSNSANAVMI